ncbi:MAG: TetR/AcrR family transcriptional regulator [Mycobacterium sp.]
MNKRPKDMRNRILQVALELFTKQGYDKTSLREIAERLEVSKAALYYHFMSKEDMLRALVAGIPQAFDELIAWGESLPRSVESRKGILRRLAALTSEKLNPVLRFVQANSTAIEAVSGDRESMHEVFTPGLRRIGKILVEPGADLTDQIRAIIAVNLIMMGSRPILPDVGPEATPELVSEAVLDLALELVSKRQEPPGS